MLRKRFINRRRKVVFSCGGEDSGDWASLRINNERGIGLRRLCDWCRLMWMFRGEVDLRQLEERLSRMGLVSEWRALGARFRIIRARFQFQLQTVRRLLWSFWGWRWDGDDGLYDARGGEEGGDKDL